MSLLPTRIWLYISFYPPQNQTTDTLRRTGWASMPGPVIIEQNLASGAPLRKRWPLPKARLGVIFDQAIIGKSGAEGDLLNSVRQTLGKRPSGFCPEILAYARQIGRSDCRTERRTRVTLV